VQERARLRGGRLSHRRQDVAVRVERDADFGVANRSLTTFAGTPANRRAWLRCAAARAT
jgi:hypothetical protein